jgi:hypothetical protein
MKPDTRLANSVITAFVNDAHSNPEAAEKLTICYMRC